MENSSRRGVVLVSTGGALVVLGVACVFLAYPLGHIIGAASLLLWLFAPFFVVAGVVLGVLGLVERSRS